MSLPIDIWDDFADLSTILQNDLNVTYKIKKRESAQVVNNRYIIGLCDFLSFFLIFLAPILNDIHIRLQ